MGHGFEFIYDENECIRAAKGLDVKHTENPSPSGNRQKWCGTWDGLKYLHFNTQTEGTIYGYKILQEANAHSRQICKRNSKYLSICKFNFTLQTKGVK